MPPIQQIWVVDENGLQLQMPIDEAVSLLNHANGRTAHRLHEPETKIAVASIRRAIADLRSGG